MGLFGRSSEGDKCHKDLERRAAQGDTDAMMQLGDLARDAGDADAARSWYESAHLLGRRDAKKRIGALSWDSHKREAAEYETQLRRLADENDSDALFKLALHLGVDSPEASDLLLRAADLGNTSAMIELAKASTEAGNDEEKSAWLQRAADLGSQDAMNWQAMLAYRSGDTQQAARRWREAARVADQGVQVPFGSDVDFACWVTLEPVAHIDMVSGILAITDGGRPEELSIPPHAALSERNWASTIDGKFGPSVLIDTGSIGRAVPVHQVDADDSLAWLVWLASDSVSTGLLDDLEAIRIKDAGSFAVASGSYRIADLETLKVADPMEHYYQGDGYDGYYAVWRVFRREDLVAVYVGSTHPSSSLEDDD